MGIKKQLNGKRKALLNFSISIISQLIILCFGLIVPRIVLIHYGSDTNGFTNTITQIFTYMALLEAGVGASARNALYKPIQENNKKQISIVLSSTKKFFKKISLIYGIVVIFLSSLLPILFKTQIDYWTIFFFVFFEGATNVITFYFLNTWTVFLNACGKTYITNSINLFVKVLCFILKILLALLNVNIAIIQIGYFGFSLIQLFIYWIYMKKQYYWIDCNLETTQYSLPDRGAYIIAEVSWTVFSSTDMIVLSIFASTSLSSVYSIYNLIFVSLNSLLNSAYSGIQYLLGKYYFEDIKKYIQLHDAFNSFFMASLTSLMCTAYLLTIPFVKLYTAGVNDINYVYDWLPLIFCLIQFLSWSRYVSGNLVGIAGYQKKASFVSIIEAISNIIFSIVFVNLWGIVGVAFATVISLPLKVIYCNYIADKKILHRSIWKTVRILGINYLLFSITVIIEYFCVTLSISSYWLFIGYGILFLFSFTCVSFLANLFVNKDLLGFFSLIKSRKSEKEK